MQRISAECINVKFLL